MSEIGLYYDEACSRPIKRDDAGLWQIEFGKLDVGASKAGVLYVKNRTIGIIEDIEIEGKSPSREGITVRVRPPQDKTSLMPLEAMKIYIHMESEEGIPSGEVLVGLEIRAMLTEEEINPNAIA
jgi:hypothetical protein